MMLSVVPRQKVRTQGVPVALVFGVSVLAAYYVIGIQAGINLGPCICLLLFLYIYFFSLEVIMGTPVCFGEAYRIKGVLINYHRV